MSQLAATLDGLKRSIEYLQDYIDIAGLKMYQEEMARVINYNAEMEANRYLKRKIYDAYSRFQSRAIPIPRFPSLPTTLPKVCYKRQKAYRLFPTYVLMYIVLPRTSEKFDVYAK